MPRWRRELVTGFGLALRGEAAVCRPRTPEQVVEALVDSSSLALRGAGMSYGDAAMNTGGRVLDLTAMDRILSFDPRKGVARVQPGVTIGALWRHTIAHGYWPAVVPGTMAVTVGGAAAMNVHGKNAYRVGTFGEHVLSFTLATPRGDLLVCDRERDPELFHAAIGGFGMLGCFVELELRLARVHSGRLRVRAISVPDLDAALATMEEERAGADYLVGWHDAYGRGRALGRGLIHRADKPAPGEDPEGERLLAPEHQDLPSRLLHVIPKGWIWPGMWLVAHLGAIAPVNYAKHLAGRREARRPFYFQSHGAFHFLLDYVPGWRKAFLPGGLIQFQPFVPAGVAGRVLADLIESCQRERLIPYLLVLKRHRPDPFLMTHGLDGFSLAMDFAVTRRNRKPLFDHCRRLAERVLEAGGRFYYAKDAILDGSAFRRIHGEDAVERFLALKERLDPRGVLQTDLSRRVMAGVSARTAPASARRT